MRDARRVLSTRWLVLWLAASASCGRERPWESEGDATALDPTKTASVAASARPSSTAASLMTEWLRCTEGLGATGEPLRDVTRLALACGPSTGSRRKLRTALTGTLAPGETSVLGLEAERGECLRVFAVGEPSIGELDVRVRSRNDKVIGQDRSRGPVAIVRADRPLCLLEGGALTIEIVATEGAGRYAVELWTGRAGLDAAPTPSGEAGDASEPARAPTPGEGGEARDAAPLEAP
jgi:hypothetical protein